MSFNVPYVKGIFGENINDPLGLFDKPKPQAPPPPPTTPTPPPTYEDAAFKAEQADAALRNRQGRATTVLNGPGGSATPQTATKVLLGS